MALNPFVFRNALEGKSPVISRRGSRAGTSLVKERGGHPGGESEATGVFQRQSRRITINQLVKHYHSVGEIKRETGTKQRAGDITHSGRHHEGQNGFGYNPKYNVEQGLKKSLIHQK
jgi:hypothetical protein